MVAALTSVLLADGGNLQDSTMTILGGQFAMTLVVEVGRTRAEVASDLAPVATDLDLVVSVRETATLPASPVGAPHVLRLHGADRPGLLHRATTLLADAGGNVTDLVTRLVGAPGAEVYVIMVAADLPAGADVVALTAAVAALAAELGVSATLRPVADDVL